MAGPRHGAPRHARSAAQPCGGGLSDAPHQHPRRRRRPRLQDADGRLGDRGRRQDDHRREPRRRARAGRQACRADLGGPAAPAAARVLRALLLGARPVRGAGRRPQAVGVAAQRQGRQPLDHVERPRLGSADRAPAVRGDARAPGRSARGRRLHHHRLSAGACRRRRAGGGADGRRDPVRRERAAHAARRGHRRPRPARSGRRAGSSAPSSTMSKAGGRATPTTASTPTNSRRRRTGPPRHGIACARRAPRRSRAPHTPTPATPDRAGRARRARRCAWPSRSSSSSACGAISWRDATAVTAGRRQALAGDLEAARDSFAEAEVSFQQAADRSQGPVGLAGPSRPLAGEHGATR